RRRRRRFGGQRPSRSERSAERSVAPPAPAPAAARRLRLAPAAPAPPRPWSVGLGQVRWSLVGLALRRRPHPRGDLAGAERLRPPLAPQGIVPARLPFVPPSFEGSDARRRNGGTSRMRIPPDNAIGSVPAVPHHS